jgi:hypothetical protein
MVLYHRTTAEAAKNILAEGFRDRIGYYLTGEPWSGVWVSNIPLDANEGAKGDTLLKLISRMSADDIAGYEWIEKGKGYREWLVPAELLNTRCKVKLAQDPFVPSLPG